MADKPALVEATDNEPKQTWKQRIRTSALLTVIIGICCVGVAAISHFYLLDNSIRLDESQSLWQSSHTLRGILHVISIDVHVPLYHLLLHFWQLGFGQSIESARLMSLLFFMLTIPFVYLLSRQILSRNWSIFVMVLFSFSPFMNWYANEARMYTLLVFLATLNQYFFMRLLQKRSGWTGYLLTAMVGVYSHYFFLFSLLTQGLFFLFNRSKFPAKSMRKFIAVAVTVFLWFLPWLIYFRSQGAGSTERPMLPSPSSVDFFNAFSQFVFGFQTNAVNTILVSSWPLLMLLAFFAVKRNQKINPTVSLMVTMAILPVVLAFILSVLVTPFFLSRYMVQSVAPLFIVLVWLISHYRRKLGLAAAAVLVLITGIAFVQQNYSQATPVKEDYRGVAADITRQAQPNDVIALSAPFTVYPFEYYYNGPAVIQTLPPWNRESTGAIPEFSAEELPGQVEQLSANHRYIYLVLSQDQGYENDIYTYFRDNFKLISSKEYSPGLNLYVYQVGYYTVPQLDELPAEN